MLKKIRPYTRLIIISIICVLTITLVLLEFFNGSETAVETATETGATILTPDYVVVGENTSYTKVIGKVKNDNFLEIKALTGGVVDDLNFETGEAIAKGDVIAELIPNYQDEDPLDVQLKIAKNGVEIAETNLKLAKDTQDELEEIADEQLEEFLKQRELSELDLESIEANIDALEQNFADTEDLLDDIEDYEDTIDDAYTGTGADIQLAEDGALLQNQSTLVQTENALNTIQNSILDLENAKERLEYNTEEGNSAEKIQELNRDVTKEQLEAQTELAELNLKAAELNLELLEIEKTLRDVPSPLEGTVENVFVKEGEFVNPGTTIALVKGKPKYTIEASLTNEVSAKLDSEERGFVIYNDERYKVRIDGIGKESIESSNLVIVINPPGALEDLITEGESFEINLPLINNDELSENPLIPIEAVFNAINKSYVLVPENGAVAEKEVVLGNIFGDFVEVKEGLEYGEIVLLDRGLTVGELVTGDDFEYEEEIKKSEESEEEQNENSEENTDETEEANTEAEETQTESGSNIDTN